MDFFRAPQAAAVLKHGILRRYLEVFVKKTGSTSRGGRVVFLDGYAGPGAYDDGTPGSPALAVRTAIAAKSMGRGRDLLLIFAEEDATALDELSRRLRNEGAPANYVVYPGSIEETLEYALEEADRAPLLAFFDPFGLPISFQALREKVLGRASGPRATTTELLLNFSISGVRHECGKLREPPSASTEGYRRRRATTLARVNEQLGGDWWQSIWSWDDDRIERIATGYLDMLREGGWGYWKVAVPDRWEGPPAYYLMFLTRYAPAIWLFHEHLSLAMEDFYAFCERRGQAKDQGVLFGTADRSSALESAVRQNLLRLLEAGEPLNILEHMDQIFDGVLEHARSKHLLAAANRLQAEGRLAERLRSDHLYEQFLIPT